MWLRPAIEDVVDAFIKFATTPEEYSKVVLNAAAQRRFLLSPIVLALV